MDLVLWECLCQGEAREWRRLPMNLSIISWSRKYLHSASTISDTTIQTRQQDDLVDENLVVPDSVTKGEIVQNVSQEAEQEYNKIWTEFKAACD